VNAVSGVREERFARDRALRPPPGPRRRGPGGGRRASGGVLDALRKLSRQAEPGEPARV